MGVRETLTGTDKEVWRRGNGKVKEDKKKDVEEKGRKREKRK